jgi:hypothetical protein
MLHLSKKKNNTFGHIMLRLAVLLLKFDFPLSDLSRYIFPFRKPQVVLKIEKKITGT